MDEILTAHSREKATISDSPAEKSFTLSLLPFLSTNFNILFFWSIIKSDTRSFFVAIDFRVFKKDFFRVLKSVIDTEISDIDISFCKLSS